jgi:GGDEF domain-containing protein
MSADVFCPRIAARFTFLPGALAIGGSLLVLLVAVQSSINVQLFIATLGALLGMWTVRQRARPALAPLSQSAVDGQVPAQKKTFPSDTQRLSAVGDAMIAKARSDRQPLSIAVFDFIDLPELQSVFEGRIANSFGALIAKRLQLIAPTRGVVVRTGPTTFAVLLPNFDGGRTRLAIRAALGRACCIEFDVGNSEILLVPEHAAQTVRSETTSIEQVYQQLRTELAQGQRHTERRQAYLKLERESHTRPMRLARTMPMAATIPVPLVIG